MRPWRAGINALLTDEETMQFVRRQAEAARFTISVCTGAATHWASHAIPVRQRVVRDGKLMTGGGITAGIDFALALVAELAGREIAEAIQLNLEYAPAPPFDLGNPESAPEAAARAVRSRLGPIVEERRRIIGASAP